MQCSYATLIKPCDFFMLYSVLLALPKCGVGREERSSMLKICLRKTLSGVTSSPLIWDGFLTTSFISCNIVSNFRVLSAHTKSTRISCDTLANGRIWDQKIKKKKIANHYSIPSSTNANKRVSKHVTSWHRNHKGIRMWVSFTHSHLCWHAATTTEAVYSYQSCSWTWM